MPYTEALIAETLRYSTITPQGVQHRAIRDQEFHGYLIPKDTVIKNILFGLTQENLVAESGRLLLVQIVLFFEIVTHTI
jgi:hypothetical protein